MSKGYKVYNLKTKKPLGIGKKNKWRRKKIPTTILQYNLTIKNEQSTLSTISSSSSSSALSSSSSSPSSTP
ncbi:hypothetical protein CR513_04262, partial [Mucuna pruriens]